MIKQLAVAGSGLFLTLENITINDVYIGLLCFLLFLSILKIIIEFTQWLSKKIKAAKADDGKVSKEERKAIIKEAKALTKEYFNQIKSDTELVKEKVVAELEAKQKNTSCVPIGEEQK